MKREYLNPYWGNKGYVCMVYGAGQPSIVHDTQWQATMEANRLAEMGKTVFVLELVSIHRREPQPVKTTMLRHAP